MEPKIYQEIEFFYFEIIKGNDIQTSSSNLLLLNVEDILGYAQLKACKFRKNIKSFNIKRAIDEIISIQQYQAESKNIKIGTSFHGFPIKDKKAIEMKSSKQVPTNMLNLVV